MHAGKGFQPPLSFSIPSDGSCTRSHIYLQLERLTPREARITDGDARCIAVSTPSLPSPWFLPARTSPTKSAPLLRAMFPRAFAPLFTMGITVLATLRNRLPRPYPVCCPYPARQGLPLNTGMPRPCC